MKGKPMVNHKRVYRIMKRTGLLLQRYAPRPSKTHDGKVSTLKSNLRWCSDVFGIQCFNGEQLQVAFVLDCHDREVMGWVTSSRGIDGGLIRDLMTDSMEERFGKVNHLPHRIQWLSDNGPCYVAKQTMMYGKSLGFEMCTTSPYSPESNGMAEAFVKTFKRDYVYINDLSSAEKVRGQIAVWFEDYNNHAPHKALKMMTPRQYRNDLALRCVNS
jgi:transposase InsO family protein